MSLLCFSAQETNFPTNDEINLLLTQTDVLFGQYKPLLDQEESYLAKRKAGCSQRSGSSPRAGDCIKGFPKEPQAFQ